MVRGQVVIGAVFDVKGEDNIGEFDPFFVERIKNCMSLLYQKNYIGRLQQEIIKWHSFREPSTLVNVGGGSGDKQDHHGSVEFAKERPSEAMPLLSRRGGGLTERKPMGNVKNQNQKITEKEKLNQQQDVTPR